MNDTVSERQVWTNLNAGEIVPDVMTPATWSFIQLMAGRLFDAIFGQMGLVMGEHQLFGEINGRLYFNLNTLAGAGRRLPGSANIDLTKTLGGHQTSQADAGVFTLSDADIPNLGFNRTKFIMRLPLFLIWFLIHQPSRWEHYSKEIRAKAEDALYADLSSVNEAALYEKALGLVDYFTKRGLKTISFSLVGLVYYGQLEKFCRKRLNDTDGSLAGKLVAGLSGVESAEAGLEIWRLAKLAKENGPVAEIIREKNSFSEARDLLSTTPNGITWLENWDLFMRRHGHHARGEIELGNPRWAETPDYIFDTIKSDLDSVGVNDPLHKHQAAARERNELTEESRRRLRNPYKRFVFNFVLKRAQQSGAVRENSKSAAIACVAGIRRLLLTFGERLVKRRVLTRADDVFFLSLNEIGEIADRQGLFDIPSTIAERRAAYERNKLLNPPPVVVGTWTPVADDAVDDIDSGSLKGLAASPGVITGPARVILRTDETTHILPGEILVAPYTDPGWTPYLIAASAVVTDLGGRLSHGSIIARECGVPAVVNTQTATKRIKTGQIITVDGNKGTVTCNEVK